MGKVVKNLFKGKVRGVTALVVLAVLLISNTAVIHAVNKRSEEKKVTKKTTSLRLESSQKSYSAADTLDLTLNASIVDEITPTGAITFTANSKELGTVNLDKKGAATFSAPMSKLKLATGVNQLKAVYAGDANFNSIESNDVEVIIGHQTTVSIRSEKTNYELSEALSIVTKVTSTETDSTPTGSVEIWANKKLITSTKLRSADEVTIDLSGKLNAGRNILTAKYLGNELFAPKTSENLELQISENTATELVISRKNILASEKITLSATAKTERGVGVLGKINFYANDKLLAEQDLDKAGAASIELAASTIGSGRQTIHAVYTPSEGSNFLASTSKKQDVSIIGPSTDTDQDGVPDELEIGEDLENPLDTDGDKIPDYMDDDSDSDNITDAIENNSPFNGDANGDAVQDRLQENVATFVNPITEKYITVAAKNSTIARFQKMTKIPEEQLAIQNEEVDFAHGLTDYELSVEEGASATIETIYHEDFDSQHCMFFKFVNGEYIDITNKVDFKDRIINGKKSVVASYNIEDGGPMDQDGLVNGIIVDPSGIGHPGVEGLAETGSSAIIQATAFGLISTACALYITRRTKD